MLGKRSKRYSNKPAVLAFFVLLTIVCLLLYWCILAPIVSRFWVSEDDIYQGEKYYNSGDYLGFDDGKEFQDMLRDFDVPGKGKVVDFYYLDTHVQDNPIYGKMCDIYAIDVHYPFDEYHLLKDGIKECHASHQARGDFISYALPYDTTFYQKIRVISFCDKANIVRYIMITEFDTTDGFDQVFGLNANLNWEY